MRSIEFALCEAKDSFKKHHSVNQTDVKYAHIDYIHSPLDLFEEQFNQLEAFKSMLTPIFQKDDLLQNSIIWPILLDKLSIHKTYSNWFSVIIKECNLKKNEIRLLSNEIFKNKKLFLLELYPKLLYFNYDYNKRLELIPVVSPLWLEPGAIHFIKKLTTKTQLLLLKRLTENDRHTLKDTINMAKFSSEPIKINFNNLRAIHDYLITYIRKNCIIADSFFDQAIKVKTSLFKEFQIIIPKSQQELINISKVLNNCVGTYTPAIKANRSIVIALTQCNKYIYCIELDPISLKLRQLVSANNECQMQSQLAIEFQLFIDDNITTL